MLLKTLTPTQLELLNQSAPVLSAVDAVDFTSPRTTAAAPIDGPWYATGHASATATEVLGMAVLLAIYFERKSSDRNEAGARQDRCNNQQDLGSLWAPLADSATWSVNGEILKPLKEAVSVRLGPSGVVQSASEIIAAWPHEQSAVTPGAMDSYLMRLVLAKTHKRALLGPKYDGKNSSARLVSAIPAIAALLSEHGSLLRHFVERHAVEPSYANETKADLIDRMEVEKEEMEEQKVEMEEQHAAEVSKLEGEVKTLKGKVTTEQKAKSKAQSRANTLDATKKGHTKRVRDDEKAKAREELSKVRLTWLGQSQLAVSIYLFIIIPLITSFHSHTNLVHLFTTPKD